MSTAYRLNVARDVDHDEDVLILNLPAGWRFDDEVVHTRGFDTMSELRKAARTEVIRCSCPGCWRPVWSAEEL